MSDLKEENIGLDNDEDFEDEREKNNNASIKIASSYSTEEATRKSLDKAAETFAKPPSYTGNRDLYDDSMAKQKAKNIAFKDGVIVRDPYTGDRLVLTNDEAKQLYGDNWMKHAAQTDHSVPIEKIYEETKKNPWVTTEDVKKAANCDDNLIVISAKNNNAKRSKTNKEFVNATDYLKRKGIEISDAGAKQAIEDAKKAEKSINNQLNISTAKNIVKTGNDAGIAGAKNAGTTALTMSGIMNIVAVIKGDKDSSEAIEDTIKDAGAATVTGYAMSGGLTVVAHSLSESSSKFIQSLVNSNVPGKVITAVIATGDTLKSFAEGKINTQECLIQLGDKGLNMATMGYGMAVGQTLIPIPGIGAAVGALVGSMLTSELYSSFISSLQDNELKHQERQKIIEQSRIAAEQTKAFREELEVYLEAYFKEYKDCFDGALSNMRFACQVGDADSIIASANSITRKLGGNVKFKSVDEFKATWDDEDEL